MKNGYFSSKKSLNKHLYTLRSVFCNAKSDLQVSSAVLIWFFVKKVSKSVIFTKIGNGNGAKPMPFFESAPQN